MNKSVLAMFLLLTPLSSLAEVDISEKEPSSIACEDINSLSDEQLKILATGVLIGATAEGVSISILSRIGLENENDQEFVRGVSYSAFSSLTFKLVVDTLKNECKDKSNSKKQVVEMLVDVIQNTILSTYIE